MTPHQLGSRLRDQLLNDQLQGRGFDPRRLQGVIADLCSGELADLVVPLRYLVLSNAFASAARQDPPLADGRLLGRLEDELAQMYAAPLCLKLRPVLEGLLGLPEGLQAAAMPAQASAAATAAFTAAAPAAPAPVWQAAPAAAAGGAARSGQTALNGVLAFLSGVLLMALAGIGVLLWQRQQSPGLSQAPSPTSGAGLRRAQPPAAAAAPPSAPPPVAAPAPTPQTPPPSVASPDRAVNSIQALYSALSSKDFAQARSLFGPVAADQFDPGFFEQFERVTVQDLRATSEVGATVNLEGLVTFVWPDGSVQTETRSFSVDTSSDPPLITASEFGRVVKPR